MPIACEDTNQNRDCWIDQREGYSEEEIFNMLQKSSEEDVNKQLGGFWAIPLPNDEQDESEIQTRYLKK